MLKCNATGGPFVMEAIYFNAAFSLTGIISNPNDKVISSMSIPFVYVPALPAAMSS